MALTGKILVFWIGGCLWEVVSYERWLHLEVQQYLFIYICPFQARKRQARGGHVAQNTAQKDQCLALACAPLKNTIK